MKFKKHEIVRLLIKLAFRSKSRKCSKSKQRIQAITVGGKPLEVVENFTYLGSVIDHSGGTAADVRSRVAQARTAFKTLDKIWRDRTISTKTNVTRPSWVDSLDLLSHYYNRTHWSSYL